MALTELQVTVSFLPAREAELGSFRFLCWLVANSVGSNTMFLLLLKLSAKLFPNLRHANDFSCNQGPWSLAMICLTDQALGNPEQRANLMGIVEMKQKWYPLAVGLMLSVLNGSIQWETFAAVFFAYLWRRFNLDRCLPSRRSAAKLEDQLQLPGVLGLLGGVWVPAMHFRPRPRERRESAMLSHWNSHSCQLHKTPHCHQGTRKTHKT